MGRLIDADALIHDITKLYCEDCEKRKGIKNGKLKFVYEIGDAPCRACNLDDMKDAIENAPTVEAEPIRHGHWNKEENTLFRLCVYKCSLCGGEVLSEAYLFKYCPYCGCAIKMEVEE